MSGVGEALAIVSCVAGLIQAYDAGARIIRQIKARRQAHVALPPSDLLEESIEKGKKEIEQVVSEGNKRFGPTFEQGDSTDHTQTLWWTLLTDDSDCHHRTTKDHNRYSECPPRRPHPGQRRRWYY